MPIPDFQSFMLPVLELSSDVKEYASHIDPRVVLIDGRQLAEYMVDLNLGVTPKASYELKRIDSDYFVEE